MDRNKATRKRKIVIIENKIRLLRERRSWTQVELARRAGMTEHGILNIENHRNTPTKKSRNAIAAAFGLPVEEIFKAREEDAPEQVSSNAA